MSIRRERLFTWLVSVNVAALIVSNLLATKLLIFLSISVDAGILLYPVTYVIGDLLVEFFGKDRANHSAIVASILTLGSSLTLALAVHLPAYPGWDGQAAFASVFGFFPRVVFGSVLAFVSSALINNLIFDRLRATDNRFAFRALGSSAIAKAIDIAVFEAVAFLGVLSFREFLTQAAFAYVAGLALECALFPLITRPAHRLIQKYLQKSPL